MVAQRLSAGNVLDSMLPVVVEVGPSKIGAVFEAGRDPAHVVLFIFVQGVLRGDDHQRLRVELAHSESGDTRTAESLGAQ